MATLPRAAPSAAGTARRRNRENVVFVGNRGVGKSLLLFTMCLKWSEATVHAYEYIPTTFDTFGTPVRVTVPGGPVALSITELGGDLALTEHTPAPHVVIICFSVVDGLSFRDAYTVWYRWAASLPVKPIVVLMGLQTDRLELPSAGDSSDSLDDEAALQLCVLARDAAPSLPAAPAAGPRPSALVETLRARVHRWWAALPAALPAGILPRRRQRRPPAPAPEDTPWPPLLALPDEVLLLILGALDLPSLDRLSGTCRRMHQLCRDPTAVAIAARNGISYAETAALAERMGASLCQWINAKDPGAHDAWLRFLWTLIPRIM